ncbi:MAG: hypothetical protein NT176_13255, partial [Proteobacteria bacterium]|nr:hypothetical protein [Pseudomonadota bacterium]
NGPDRRLDQLGVHERHDAGQVSSFGLPLNPAVALTGGEADTQVSAFFIALCGSGFGTNLLD